MNKQRKKNVEVIIEDIEAIRTRIEDLRMEEEDAYNNMPIGLQDSDRGYDMSDNVCDFESAESYIQCCIDSLNDIIER